MAVSSDVHQTDSLADLRDGARSCRRCPLWRDATQMVFGQGPSDAALVFVGEQLGDQEDIAGAPFVGPAGQLFNIVLEEAGIDRDQVYVTNAVKHFKFQQRGKRRIHAKPNAGEVRSCYWWLDKEFQLLKPRIAVALGATAALSLIGKSIGVTQLRGTTVVRDDGLVVFITIHPSFILRIPEQASRRTERERFLRDLISVRETMRA